MMPVVKMPDGQKVSFPDEMPREQIRSLISSKFPNEIAEMQRQQKIDSAEQESQGGGVLDTLKSGYDWVAGNVAARPDAGEFEDTGSLSGNLKAAAGFVATPSDFGRANILQNINPEIEIQQDEDGHYMARLPGEEWDYINKPGLSAQDFTTVVAEIVKYLPAAKAGGMVAKTLAGRAGVTGVSSGLTSGTEDWAADQLGSGTGIDPVKAGVATLFGGLSEPVAKTAAVLWRKMPWKRGLVTSTGELTDKGVEAAKAAGIDPEKVTPEIAKALDDMARKGLDFTDDAQAVIAGEVVDPQRIPATAGEAAGNRGQMAAEAAMEAGGRGPQARVIVEDFRRKQGSAMVTAADDLSRGLDDPLDAANVIGTAIKDKADDAWNAVNDAYDAFRQSPGAFNTESYNAFTKNTLRKRFAYEGIDLENSPAAKFALSVLKRAAPSGSSVKMKPVTITRIERSRQDLLKAWRTAEPADKHIYGTAVAALDAWYDKALRTALVSGDKAQIKTLVTVARESRKKYAAQFGKNDVKGARGRMTDDAGDFVEKVVIGKLTSSELAQKLFDKGVRNSGTSTRVVQRLETIFGRGSDEWALLEGGALRNLLSGKGGMLRGVRLDQNGQAMLSNDAIGTLVRDIKNYVKTDYAKALHGDNLTAVTGYADELLKFARDKTMASTSGSDQGNLRAIYDLTHRMLRAAGIGDLVVGGGVTTLAAGEALKTAGSVSSRRAAEKATRGLVLPIVDGPVVRGMVAGGAAAGATLGSGNIERQPLELTVRPLPLSERR